LFGSEISAELTPELKIFRENFNAGRWQDLSKTRNFLGDSDAEEVYFLSCPAGACMLYVRNPVELFDSYELLAAKIPGASEVVEIGKMDVELHAL
jgi:hypothetical protein